MWPRIGNSKRKRPFSASIVARVLRADNLLWEISAQEGESTARKWKKKKRRNGWNRNRKKLLQTLADFHIFKWEENLHGNWESDMKIWKRNNLPQLLHIFYVLLFTQHSFGLYGFIHLKRMQHRNADSGCFSPFLAFSSQVCLLCDKKIWNMILRATLGKI